MTTYSPDFLIWNRFREDEEGGYANTPGDRGGPTRYGITESLLVHLHRLGQFLDVDFDTITRDQATEIAHTVFWRLVGGDWLPGLIALTLADYGFNSSAERARKALQFEIGVKADGDLGPITRAKLDQVCARVGARHLAQSVHVRRCRFLADIHQSGSIVRGNLSLQEETKFLEGLWVRTARLAFLIGGA